MSVEADDRTAQLIAMLARYSARRGHFTLASGKSSDLYIDARLTTMHPAGLTLIGPLALDTLRGRDWGRRVTAVGGLTLGADPISYAISYASAAATATQGALHGALHGAPQGAPQGAPLRAFTVRKEAKTHGTGQLIEGPFHQGDVVAVIEDVITSGGSAIRAVQAIRAAGGTVAGVLALVDREEGGRAAIEASGAPVVALVRASEIVARMG